MNVSIGKSLPWILGSVAMLAVVGAILAGVLLSAGSSQATTAVPQDIFTGTVPTTDPVDASLAPASPEFATVIENEGGNPTAPEQVTVIPTNVEICYTDTQTGVEECKSPEDTALLEDWNPVRTQHTFTVKVTQANGAAAANVPVELILNRFGEAVGDIVSITGGAKVDNTFGNVTTNRNGEADFVITSTRAGDTDVTAYVPGISDADDHKVFAVKHWVDMDVHFPGNATNPAGQAHEMVVLVFQPTAGTSGEDENGYPIPVTALEGVTVDWSITDNEPAATLDSMSMPTNASGQSVVTLNQVSPSVGDNTVNFQVKDEAGRVMFEGSLVKTWIAQEIHVTKTGTAAIGLLANAQYTITITNGGTAPATGLTLTDIVPPGMKYVSASPEPTTAPTEDSGGTITWTLADLAADGGSTDITVTLQGVEVGTHTNSVTATSGDSEASDSAATSVTPGTFAVSKECQDQVLINIEFDCSITVTNNSDSGALTGVTLTDNPGSDMVFKSSNPDVTDTDNPTWNLGTMMPGASHTVTITMQAPTTGNKTNTASVVSDEGVTGSDDDTIEFIEQGPAIHFQIVDNPGRIAIGENTTLTATVVNQDTEIGLTDVVMTVTLPDQLTFVSASGGGSAVGQIVTFNLGDIATGATVTRTVTAQANARGQVQTNGLVDASQLTEPFPAFQFTTIVGN